MNHKIKLNNKILKLYLVCLLLGIIIGFLFYFNLNKNEIESLIISIKQNKVLFKTCNNAINHLKIMSVILVLSYFFIGIPLFIGLLITESFKITLRLIILSKIYRFKGIIYGLLYTIFNNGIYIILLIFILKKLLKIVKILYKNKIKKENINYASLYSNFINVISLTILIFISDLLIYMYGNNILNLFRSMCKI